MLFPGVVSYIKNTLEMCTLQSMHILEPRFVIRDKVQLVASLKSKQVYLVYLVCSLKGAVYFIMMMKVESINWNCIYSAIYRTTIDTKMREFQFKAIHHIQYCPSNHKLYRWTLIASDRCSLCYLHPETVEHLFCCLDSVNFYFD